MCNFPGDVTWDLFKKAFVVTILELQRFYTLDLISMIYSSKARSFCMLYFDTKKCCIGITIHKMQETKLRCLKI